MVDHADVVALADQNADWILKLAVAPVPSEPNWLRYTPAELNIWTRLSAQVGYGDVVVDCIDCSHVRTAELPIETANGAELAQIRTRGIEYLHAMVGAVDDHDVAGG